MVALYLFYDLKSNSTIRSSWCSNRIRSDNFKIWPLTRRAYWKWKGAICHHLRAATTAHLRKCSNKSTPNQQPSVKQRLLWWRRSRTRTSKSFLKSIDHTIHTAIKNGNHIFQQILSQKTTYMVKQIVPPSQPGSSLTSSIIPWRDSHNSRN